MSEIKTKDFKIKTEFLSRPNGDLQGHWPCGIDMGYSAVKLFTPNRVAIFPSFALPSDLDEIGEPGPDHIRYTNLETKESWLVGNAAQLHISQGDLRYNDTNLYGRDRYENKMFAVLIDTALGFCLMENQYGSFEGRKLSIQTGLPSQYIKRDRADLIAAFSGRHHFSLKVGGEKEKTFDITIEKSQIDVMEQPMGTLMSVAMGNDHSFTPQASGFFNKNAIIFDGGHGTLDLFFIKNHTVQQRLTYPNYSMHQLLAKTRAAIEEEHGTEISPIAMQKCLEQGCFFKSTKFSSESISFEDLLLEQSEAMCKEAMESIASDYPLYDFNYFIVTGGTGAAWFLQIKDLLKNLEGLEVIPGNQNDPTLAFDFANARGYFMRLYGSIVRAQRKAEKEKEKAKDDA